MEKDDVDHIFNNIEQIILFSMFVLVLLFVFIHGYRYSMNVEKFEQKNDVVTNNNYK